jgi:hypothetical protein
MAKAKASRVEIFVPRTSGNKEADLFIGVNGVNYLLPRGKKSMVPPEVAEEFYRSQEAQEKMFEEQEALRAK